MADIILTDPNKIIVNDGSGGSNILDVTWNVEAVYGPVALDGEGNEVEGVTGIDYELDGITSEQILEHIDNGGLVRYHLNETAPEGYNDWISNILDNDPVVCDGYYKFKADGRGTVIIDPHSIDVCGFLNYVGVENGNATLYSALSEYPFQLYMLYQEEDISSGTYYDDNVEGSFIAQFDFQNGGYILRVVTPTGEGTATNAIYRVSLVDNYPVAQEIQIGSGGFAPVRIEAQLAGNELVNVTKDAIEFIDELGLKYQDNPVSGYDYEFLLFYGTENDDFFIPCKLDKVSKLGRIFIPTFIGFDKENQYLISISTGEDTAEWTISIERKYTEKYKVGIGIYHDEIGSKYFKPLAYIEIPKSDFDNMDLTFDNLFPWGYDEQNRVCVLTYGSTGSDYTTLGEITNYIQNHLAANSDVSLQTTSVLYDRTSIDKSLLSATFDEYANGISIDIIPLSDPSTKKEIMAYNANGQVYIADNSGILQQDDKLALFYVDNDRLL